MDERTQKTEFDADVIKRIVPTLKWTIRAIADGRFSIASHGISNIRSDVEGRLPEHMRLAFDDMLNAALAELEDIELHRGAAESRDSGEGRRVPDFRGALETHG